MLKTVENLIMFEEGVNTYLSFAILVDSLLILNQIMKLTK